MHRRRDNGKQGKVNKRVSRNVNIGVRFYVYSSFREKNYREWGFHALEELG